MFKVSVFYEIIVSLKAGLVSVVLIARSPDLKLLNTWQGCRKCLLMKERKKGKKGRLQKQGPHLVLPGYACPGPGPQAPAASPLDIGRREPLRAGNLSHSQ